MNTCSFLQYSHQSGPEFSHSRVYLCASSTNKPQLSVRVSSSIYKALSKSTAFLITEHEGAEGETETGEAPIRKAGATSFQGLCRHRTCPLRQGGARQAYDICLVSLSQPGRNNLCFASGRLPAPHLRVC